MHCKKCPFEKEYLFMSFGCLALCPKFGDNGWFLTLSKFAHIYYPNLRDRVYRNRLLIKRIEEAGVYKYLSAAKRKRKLRGNTLITYQDFLIIMRNVGEPPLKPQKEEKGIGYPDFDKKIRLDFDKEEVKKIIRNFKILKTENGIPKDRESPH